MKYLFTAFLFLAIVKIDLAQNSDEPNYKIIMKGVDLPGDTFISVIGKSYNDTFTIRSLTGQNNFKVLSFDITIAHKDKDLVSYPN